MDNKQPRIGTLSEKSLHATLKAHYTQSGDLVEFPVGGFVIDIVRGHQLLEIQTGNFSALKRKFEQLLPDYQIHLIAPIAQTKWIVRQTAVAETIRRRKSPKRGRVEDIFAQLLYIAPWLTHPNLTVEVVLVEVDEIWRDDGQGSWRRRGWSIADRVLLSIVESFTFNEGSEWLRLLPEGLKRPFTNHALTAALRLRPNLAQKMTYTLRHADLLDVVGKQGNAYLYDLQI